MLLVYPAEGWMDVYATHQSSLPAHTATSRGPKESGRWLVRACQVQPIAIRTQTMKNQELPAKRLLVKMTSQRTLTTQTQLSLGTWTGASSGAVAPGCCTYVMPTKAIVTPYACQLSPKQSCSSWARNAAEGKALHLFLHLLCLKDTRNAYR